MSKISVIIPVHNTANYLHKCVESVRNQTLEDIEIILVENLSDDGSSEMCDEYARIDPRIKVLHLPVAGLSFARNAGIDVASSPYIGFVDSDDYIAPQMYEEMFRAMDTYQVDMVYCNFCYVYEDGRIEQLYSNEGGVYLRDGREVARDLIQNKVSSASWSKLYKKELFATLRFPVGFYFEDHGTLCQWALMCSGIVWLDTSFYFYLQREASICHSFTPVKYYHFFLADYSRIAFAREQKLLQGEELKEVVSSITRDSLWRFKTVMLMTKPKYLAEPIKEMRRKLGELLYLPSDELEQKYRSKIRRIVYSWPIYYLTHFAFKKREWRPSN